MFKTQVFVAIIKCSEPDTHYCACKLDIENVKKKNVVRWRSSHRYILLLFFPFVHAKKMHENVSDQVLVD